MNHSARPPATDTAGIDALTGKVVHAVYSCRFLTAAQISRLFPQNHDRTEDAVSLLVNSEYLTAIKRPTLDPYAPNVVYALGQRGASLVADRLGIDRRHVTWRKYQNSVGLQFLDHRLAVNDVRIALTMGLARLGGRVEYWWYEFKIEENIDDPDELAPPLKLRPDAYARCRARVRGCHFFIEADLATESHPRFGGKVRRYLAYKDSTLFRAHLGGKAFRVLIVVPGPSRLRALKRVVENEGGQRIFWLATLPDVTERNIDAPIWQLAGETQPARLFASPTLHPSC